MERREGLAPIEVTSEALRKISQEHDMNFGMEAGKYKLSKDGFDGIVDVDFDGSIKSFQLHDPEGAEIMSMGKTDLDTVRENIIGYANKAILAKLEETEAAMPSSARLDASQARQPLSENIQHLPQTEIADEDQAAAA